MILLTLAVGQAKDFSDLFDEFRKEQHADYVSVSPIMMKMARMFTPADEGGDFLPSNPQLSSSASFLRLNVLSSLN